MGDAVNDYLPGGDKDPSGGYADPAGAYVGDYFRDSVDDFTDVFGDWAQSYGDAQANLQGAGQTALETATTQDAAEQETRNQRYRDAYFSGSSQAPTVLNGGD